MAKRSMPEKIVEAPEVNAEEAVIMGPIVAVEPDPVIGIVSGCTRLNVRKKPSKAAEVKTEINANAELEIDIEKSNDEWYKVRTKSGVTGYCMKKFVTVK